MGSIRTAEMDLPDRAKSQPNDENTDGSRQFEGVENLEKKGEEEEEEEDEEGMDTGAKALSKLLQTSSVSSSVYQEGSYTNIH